MRTNNGKEHQVFFNYVFDLYGKVKKGDKQAIQEFYDLYAEKFPKNGNPKEWQGFDTVAKREHTMYLHLTH